MSSPPGPTDPASTGRSPSYQLDIGRVLSRTFSITLDNLPSFGTVGVICHLPILCVQAVLVLLPPTPQAMVAVNWALTAVQTLTSFFLTGALTFGLMGHLNGDRPSVVAILRAGLSSGRVFAVSVTAGLASYVGSLLCLFPGVILTCMNWVTVPVAVVERAGVRVSFDRSHDLTLGTRRAIFGVVAVMGLATTVVALAGGLGSVALAGGDASAPARQVAGILLTLVLIPFECLRAASAAVGYHELRTNREGVGLDELVRVFE